MIKPWWQSKTMWGALITLLFCLAIAVPSAFAQDASTIAPKPLDQLIADACANNGAWLRWVAGALGASVAGSFLANFRSKFPPWLVTVLDAVALNFFKKTPVPPVIGVVEKTAQIVEAAQEKKQ